MKCPGCCTDNVELPTQATLSLQLVEAQAVCKLCHMVVKLRYMLASVATNASVYSTENAAQLGARNPGCGETILLNTAVELKQPAAAQVVHQPVEVPPWKEVAQPSAPLPPALAGAETASTGAIRSKLYPEGYNGFPARYDLVLRNEPGMRRLAATYGEGFKYGRDNWKAGFPESVYFSHAMDHVLKYLDGDRSEDHMAHAAWNFLNIIYIEERHPELLDLSGPAPERGS